MATCFAPASRADSDDALTVWFDAEFDAQGRLESLQPQQETVHPQAFWAELKGRLAEASIEPMRREGRPARLRTGLAVALQVRRDAQDGSVRIQGLRISPLPMRQDFVGYPKDIARVPGWSGEFRASCTVGVGGRCQPSSIEVAAVPGIPDSVRRWARASLALWEFRPQQLDGVPIEGRYQFAGGLKTNDAFPRNFRDPRKL